MTQAEKLEQEFHNDLEIDDWSYYENSDMLWEWVANKLRKA